MARNRGPTPEEIAWLIQGAERFAENYRVSAERSRLASDAGAVSAHVADIITPPCTSGVYMLCDQGPVVYVGQSIDVFARVSAHEREGKKEYDRAVWFPVQAELLDPVEAELITALRPKYNHDRHGDLCGRRTGHPAMWVRRGQLLGALGVSVEE